MCFRLRIKNTTNAVNKAGQVVSIESDFQVPTGLHNDGGASRDSHRGLNKEKLKIF